MSMTIKKLTTLEEMALYSDGYWHSFDGRSTRSIHPLNPEVMKEDYDNVFGVYDQEVMVGGFIVNCYPIRCFDGISNKERMALTKDIGGESACGELVAIWKKKGQKGFSTKVWPRMIIESLRTGKKNIVGSVYSSNKMKETYSVLGPHILTTIGESNPLEVFYYERSRFVGTFFANAAIRTTSSLLKPFKIKLWEIDRS